MPDAVGIEDVGIVNLTTQESAPDVRLSPDGSFQAFVPVREGKNRVLVNALASDGSEANVELEFDFKVAEKKGLEKQAELARLRKLNDELIRHVEATVGGAPPEAGAEVEARA